MNGFLVVIRFSGYDIPASLHATEDEAFAAALDVFDPERLDSTLERLGGEWDAEDYESTFVVEFVDGRPFRLRSLGTFADSTAPDWQKPFGS
jgi:hypothetical protein